MEYLTKPMTYEEIKENMDDNCFIKGNIVINLSEIIDNDFEGFLDIISNRLVGSPLLMDINYNVVGCENGDVLIIQVRGDVSNIIEYNE